MTRPLPFGVRQEQRREPPLQFTTHVAQIQHPPRASRELDAHLVAVKMVVTLERLDEQIVHRKPHRAAPVRVAAEQARVRFPRHIIHAMLLPARLENVRLLVVKFRQRADAERRQKLRLVQQIPQHPHEPRLRRNRQQPPPMPVFAISHLMPQARLIFQKPFQPFVKSRQLPNLVLLQNLHRDQWQQAHHRARLQRDHLVIREQLVVIESVRLVPQPRPAERVHRVGNLHEVLKKLRRHVLVGAMHLGAVVREFQRDRHHREAVERHPRRAVGLLQRAARRQRFRAIEHAHVVQPEKSAGEKILAVRVLAIHPPREIQQQLLKNALEKIPVPLARARRNFVNAPRRPRMNRRVHIAERKFIRGNLPVRVHIPFAQQQAELPLRKFAVDPRERNHVKRQIPRREPRILPRVRHRKNVAAEHVFPLAVAPLLAALRRRRRARIALAPIRDHVVIKLFAPQQARVALPDHHVLRAREIRRGHRRVKLIRLANPRCEHRLEFLPKRRPLRLLRLRVEPQPHHARRARRERHLIPRRGLRAVALGIHRLLAPADHALVKCVLHPAPVVLRAVQARVIRLVVREQNTRQFLVRARLELEEKFPERFVRTRHTPRAVTRDARLHRTTLVRATPAPRVAKPHARQQMQLRRVRPAIRDRDADENIVRRTLRVLDAHIEVAALREHARVHQLELRLLPRPPPILLDQLRVRKLALRILVERLQVGMRRRGIQKEIILLHILAVIPLVRRETEQALLQNRIAPIPQRQSETQPALAIRDPEQPILAPAIRPTARVIVREIIPARSVSGIILAHRRPLPLREIRPPAFPILRARRILGQSLGFRRER